MKYLLFIIINLISIIAFTQNNNEKFETSVFLMKKKEIYKIKYVYYIRDGENINKILGKPYNIDTIGIYNKKNGYWYLINTNKIIEKGKFKPEKPINLINLIFRREFFVRKNKKWQYWNKDGKLIREEIWHKGKLIETKEY